MNCVTPALVILSATCLTTSAEMVSLCDTTPRAITSGSPAVIVFDAALPAGATVDAVTIDLDLDHDWLGDLRVHLGHDSAGAVLMDRPNLGLYPFGCGGRDLVATFDDDAVTTPDDLCVATTPDPQPEPMLTGLLRPDQPLGAFAGLEAGGGWTLTITDFGALDDGTLHEVCLHITYTLPPPLCPDTTGDGNVNFDDLNVILAQWGTAGPDGDVAPPGGNGVVDFDDLNAVLTSWGQSCP
ncbi:MAG: hypothetical protein KDA21_12030 [Phycisphaerales bacterium]|nr:hypothetical protein [Phycisphaerales bacterium]